MVDNRCEVRFVVESNNFEVKMFGTAEGADGKPVEVLKGTHRITVEIVKQKLEAARIALGEAEAMVKAVAVAAKKAAKDAADKLAAEAGE